MPKFENGDSLYLKYGESRQHHDFPPSGSKHLIDELRLEADNSMISAASIELYNVEPTTGGQSRAFIKVHSGKLALI